jgi:hypothetical protein
MARADQRPVQELGDGYPGPRVYHREARGKKSARLLIKMRQLTCITLK